MATLEQVSLEDEIDQEILNSSTDDIINRTRLLENDIKVRFTAVMFLGSLSGHEIRNATVNTRTESYE